MSRCRPHTPGPGCGACEVVAERETGGRLLYYRLGSKSIDKAITDNWSEVPAYMFDKSNPFYGKDRVDSC